jgi:hypothetical protein
MDMSVQQSYLSPSSIELRDNVDDFVIKLHESWNDRLEFPPTKIGERYLRNKLTVALKVMHHVGLREFGMCALVSFDNALHRQRKVSAPTRNG